MSSLNWYWNAAPRKDVAGVQRMESMSERPEPQPMSTFDPTQPVVVHEQLNDVEVEWVPVSAEEWQSKARWQDDDRTVVQWKEMLLDRWWPPGGEEHPAD
jgi:hypothetical protein